MKAFISFLFVVFLFAQARAQQPAAGKNFQISYDASSTSLSAAKEVSGIVIFYPYRGKPVTRFLELKKKGRLWSTITHIPDSAVLVRMVYEDKSYELKDNNQGKGYLLPVYKQNKPVQFAYAQMALISGDGPPDTYGLKRDHKRALAFMKKELEYHPENEVLLRQQFYNMLANSPEREDKADLVKRLTAMKSDQEADLMMAQLYLSFLGTKRQADSLDKLLTARFPDGNYVKAKKLKEELPIGKTIPAPHAEMAHKKISKMDIVKEVEENLVDEPAGHISLKDIDGNTVHIGAGALKGKVIVLDFWATWCKPCIASFPAMQKVMEQYRNNPSVQFFFISTMEQGDAVRNVRAFIAKNTYSFTILMDEKTDDMNLYKAYSGYKAEGGIPYKLVIDGKGRIRSRKSGFSGNDEELVAELSAMIDIALKY